MTWREWRIFVMGAVTHMAMVMLVQRLIPPIPHAYGSDFVFRGCIAEDDFDISMREVDARGNADMCVWATTCDAAEIRIHLDPNAKRSFWRSNSPERCR